MQRDDVAYFLTAQNIEPEDVNRLIQKIQEEQLFGGVLTPDFSEDDLKNKRIFFDCGMHGSTEAIDRSDVDQIMHDLAMSFPGTQFSLLAENLDHALDQYQICTYKDLYQSSQLQTHMPSLSAPVPFDQRDTVSPPVPARDFLGEFFTNTDFNLLYQQKQALLRALDEASDPLPWQNGAGLSAETLEGLVNFLDFIGDWAEHEGFFDYPITEESRKPALDSIIAAAGSRAGNSSASGTRQPPENEHG